VEMAETERSRGARPEVLFPLYVKALDKDPAGCEALWGAGKLGWDAAARGKDEESAAARVTALGRLGRYLTVCPRAPEAAAARAIVDAAGK